MSGFRTPPRSNGGQSNNVAVVIAPAPNAAAPYEVSYEKVLVRGTADPLSPIPKDTSDSGGSLGVSVNANFGTDYEDEIYIVTTPNEAGNSPVRLGPIIAKQE
jgi:hypothetical protein